MCIQEVRAGQRSSTIAQAMAHNTSTVERDLDMFEKLLKARGEQELLTTVLAAHEHLRHAYAAFLDVYGEELATEVLHEHEHGNDTEHLTADHEHASLTDLAAAIEAGEQVGNERVLVEAEKHDAQLARKFETR